MVGHIYSNGPDHSKSEPLEIWTKWLPICAKRNAFLLSQKRPNLGQTCSSIFNLFSFAAFFRSSLSVVLSRDKASVFRSVKILSFGFKSKPLSHHSVHSDGRLSYKRKLSARSNYQVSEDHFQ